ncbi:MAG: hypothetical protein MJ162_05035, partial [Treponema sp.]|nr:hypothetical protein [Treponema sp.]
VEIQDIVRNLETMNTAFNKILTDNKYSSRERINSTDYAYRQVQLIEIDGYYWTSMLHWDRDSGAPATFQASGNLDEAALRWLGMYNDTEYNDLGSHTYKGESIILYQTALDNRTSDEGLFYMDRCVRYTGWSSGLTADWAHQDMKTHAMALITLNE